MGYMTAYMDCQNCGKVWSTSRKELRSFFSSPVALLFLATFLVAEVFIFFNVEKFFSRNIADVRPLFDWMPILLIFLVSALTMRVWSEETRLGTIELLLTLPISITRLVLGKFLACLILVIVGLLLTLPIPITVSYMGEIDWGPIIAAYLACIMLASAYIAIGLFVSARTDNQVVSLITTAVACSVFLLLGSQVVGSLVSNHSAEILALFGTGSRFQSVARGVIDLRDLYYYLSLTATFLALNVYSLERQKWSFDSTSTRKFHLQWLVVTMLTVANFIVANFWLANVNWRFDWTKNKAYSISPATKTILAQLQEPLVIRGYFSAQTHPLLAPLVPQIRDLIEEYSVLGGGKVKSEFVDPRDNPELEEEASQKYNIKPIPFQIASKYQAGLVNSYFNILLKYGDKFEVLGFEDLIEVKVKGESELDVRLRNPEYDITRAIKKVLYGFQNVENLFASIRTPVKFVAYVSADQKLPPALKDYAEKVKKESENLAKISGGKMTVEFVDPQADNGKVGAEILKSFGFQPMVASLFDSKQFYFYLTFQQGNKVVQIALPEELNEQNAKKGLESALKRYSVGFTRTAGLVVPEQKEQQPWQRQMGMNQDQKQFNLLQQKLSENYEVRTVDLKNGMVPEEIDILVVMSPEKFDEKKVFAVDQFLMKGGTVLLATSPFTINREQNSLRATPSKSGLEDWLANNGIKIEDKLVMDQRSEQYPVPVQRRAGAFIVNELRMLDYPYFVDIRGDGMLQQNGITSGLTQVTLNWPSPVTVDKEKNASRTTTEILRSSPNSWTSVSNNITPDPKTMSFARSDKLQSELLGVVVEGSFDSFFKGKNSPLLKKEEKKDNPPEAKKEENKEEKTPISSVIEHSAASARIMVIASNEFGNDQALRISASSGTTKYLNSLQLIENSLDWSLEDRALLSIRGRGQFSRTLEPMEAKSQFHWEMGNYILVAFGLLLVLFIYRAIRARGFARERSIMQEA